MTENVNQTRKTLLSFKSIIVEKPRNRKGSPKLKAKIDVLMVSSDKRFVTEQSHINIPVPKVRIKRNFCRAGRFKMNAIIKLVRTRVSTDGRARKQIKS